MNGSPKKVVEEGLARSMKFLRLDLGSLETYTIFFTLEALSCRMAFMAIPALGGSMRATISS